MTRLLGALVLIFAVATPARAQLVVFDPANFAEAVLIAERTLREYLTLVQQYQTLVRMSTALGSLSRYRMPAIGATRHDPSRWPFGRPWLAGLNSGDPDGSAYWATARRLDSPAGLLQSLPPPAREALERTYATIEIADSMAQLGGHQVALIRGYGGQLDGAIAALEGDVLSSLAGTHELTAILDKVAAGELLGRRQDMAANQLLTHALEQLLARSKRQRDTETVAMNMRVGALRDGRTAGLSVTRGVGDDLRTWRQP